MITMRSTRSVPTPFVHPRRPVTVASRSGAPLGWWLGASALGSLLLCLLLSATEAEAKRKPVQHVQPDLRILSVTASPESYSPQDGSLDFAIEVELPKDLDGATILEVSSLISSPSKRSMRFLSNRQPAGTPTTQALPQALPPGSKPRLAVTLTWDGTDQTRQAVEHGKYNYEVRAKLLAVGEKGPRTKMVSWPKRGIIEVK
ncbi:MAG: hypothetical protein FJ246_07290 [Nitrospira sp.]|nr:hypothetical protein [Nitrospira sp.]